MEKQKLLPLGSFSSSWGSLAGHSPCRSRARPMRVSMGHVPWLQSPGAIGLSPVPWVPAGNCVLREGLSVCFSQTLESPYLKTGRAVKGCMDGHKRLKESYIHIWIFLTLVFFWSILFNVKCIDIVIWIVIHKEVIGKWKHYLRHRK